MKVAETLTVDPEEFDVTLRHYLDDLGYRLDMIIPADAPREAFLRKLNSEGGQILRIRRETTPSFRPVSSEWTIGRAGMMYRDLIPGVFGSTLKASHIRLVDGGDVADSVHYHKIVFQIIYCLKGAIRVVYEDQGEPFWLRPGDCVLQPPGIRHRVLEAEAGSEVIEITSPAEHETWFDHEMELPTDHIRPDRVFGAQRFVRHRDTNATWEAPDENAASLGRTAISAGGTNAPEVYTVRAGGIQSDIVVSNESDRAVLKMVIEERGLMVISDKLDLQRVTS